MTPLLRNRHEATRPRFEPPITPSRVLAIPGTFALAEMSNGGHTLNNHVPNAATAGPSAPGCCRYSNRSVVYWASRISDGFFFRS